MAKVAKRDLLSVGTKVRTTMGVRREGEIVEDFNYKHATDGTYSAPSPGDQAVLWSDGTKGYHYRWYMEAV